MAAIEDWYDSQREGLGAEFRQVVDEAITRIADGPLAYPERYRGARRVLLRRFPYVLWYRPFESLVVVLACVHGNRDPREVRARLRRGA
ncbi:MAG: type II toxin-antitoxin system RelE/ParE family toxin [Candidatus Rokubacteria bacterium]|nr:type II toxin-antitoxin system RelE/ParE family toxin [Candidatus Rokubacteria bacterium]